MLKAYWTYPCSRVLRNLNRVGNSDSTSKVVHWSLPCLIFVSVAKQSFHNRTPCKTFRLKVWGGRTCYPPRGVLVETLIFALSPFRGYFSFIIAYLVLMLLANIFCKLFSFCTLSITQKSRLSILFLNFFIDFFDNFSFNSQPVGLYARTHLYI